jgi:hypothetical protein
LLSDNGEDANEELGIRANIWPAYLEEAFERDSEMLDAWHKSLDVLLIFASLIISPFQPSLTGPLGRPFLFAFIAARGEQLGYAPAR